MTQSDTSVRDRFSSFLNLAGHHKAQGNEPEFQAYMEKLKELAHDPSIPPSLRYSLYYLSGNFDEVVEAFDKLGASPDADLLAIMATSIHFARKEPVKALAAAKTIRNEEQRRLRIKTVELWEALNAPLPFEPRVHIIILTYNRAWCVEHALRELGKTGYRNYSVFIADNGSTDGTAEMAARAREFFPDHVPVEVQLFPTNIGRPAGHNWLLTGHDHSEAEYIAIGDDDLTLVSPDWLTRMIQTSNAFPGCACVGGKALTPGWPLKIHGGVRNLVQFGPDVVMTNNEEEADLGQMDFVDIVDHVIGCLHIFDKKALDEAGLFDIRFSPCQYVDIEHHLRMRMKGKDIVYNGLISFEHLRAMGKAAAQDRSLGGNSVGNILKLLHKYDAKEVASLISGMHERRNRWLGLGS